MPVQATGSFASCGTLNWFTPLDDPRLSAGACSTDLEYASQLARAAAGQRRQPGRRRLLWPSPTGVPLNVPGCGQNGLGAAAVGNQQTMITTSGTATALCTHLWQRRLDRPELPDLQPYASALIGEFGLDIRSGMIFDPANARDYMSYCGPRWMSLYQHNRLLQHPRLLPRWLRERSVFDDYVHVHPFDLEHLWWPDPPWLPEEVEGVKMNPVISIVGRVQDNGVVDVQSVARVSVAAAPQGGRRAGSRSSWMRRATFWRARRSCVCSITATVAAAAAAMISTRPSALQLQGARAERGARLDSPHCRS